MGKRDVEMVPFGRLMDLLDRPDADRLGFKRGKGIFDDCRVVCYASRDMLREVCRLTLDLDLDRQVVALVKDKVAPNMVAIPTFEVETGRE